MNIFLDLLRGKKAYIIGALTVLLGLANGDTQMVMSGLSVLALRAGITNTLSQAK